MYKNQGFTLIELMITVAIIGILAAIAVSAYNIYVKRTIVSIAFTEISSLKDDYELIFNENYSTINELVQLSEVDSKYCNISINSPDPLTLIAEKAISCSFKNDELFGNNAEIYLSRSAGGIYYCYVKNIAERFIPKQCKLS